jgi:hypothetical protein
MVQLYVVLVEVLDRYRLKTIWSDRRWKEVEIANHPVGTFVLVLGGRRARIFA